MNNYHFSGWATRNDLLCSDGRTIRKDAFKANDGRVVPLIWNHDHTNQKAVLGHALLQNRDEGVYAYCTLNEDTEEGRHAKKLVEHGDVRSLSIFANGLRHYGKDVIHGDIKELSLVLAGANPGAYIDYVMEHGIDGDDTIEVNYDESAIVVLCHADTTEKEEKPVAEEKKDEKTIKEVFNSAMNKLDEDEQDAVMAVIGSALEGGADDSDEGGDNMKHNIFDNKTPQDSSVLSHADQRAIIALAKQSNVGSWKQALELYCEEKGILQHSDDNVGVFEDYGVLFPEFELLKKGEPDTLFKHDQTWVTAALNKIHKAPYARIRTRFADARLAELKAKGYQNKGDKKTVMDQITMINRETAPQTIYIKDSLHRDDIIDITDFSIVDYQWRMMRTVLNETIVLAAMVGDGREIDDPDKIKEDNIRPIWKDNDEYTIHVDLDVEGARKALQGTDTGTYFGDEFVYAEAIVNASLYSREKFKGSGTPDFYCTPHLVNKMLLARDRDGHRMYKTKAELAMSLNVNSIVEVEQFEGLTRTDSEGNTKKLLGLFVNLNDYTFGSTRGGEITKFEDFDMDFNLKKFMLETRLSGSLYKLKSAIALEEPVVAG